MKIRQSKRSKSKIKIAIKGGAGTGKTYSSLLMAKGLANGDLSRVAVIDTENGSADLYAHLGNYNVITLEPPFTPEKCTEALLMCEKANMEVVIIDSLSSFWIYLLSYHASLKGNSFVNWDKVTTRQNTLINKILQTKSHIIATMRTKQSYVLNFKDGKYVPEKIGLKAIQRGGVDFEFTLVFDINSKHMCISSKDRTGMFVDKPEFSINTSTGGKILDWCNNTITESEMITKINECDDMDLLIKLHNNNPSFQKNLNHQFIEKKKQILKQDSKSNTLR